VATRFPTGTPSFPDVRVKPQRAFVDAVGDLDDRKFFEQRKIVFFSHREDKRRDKPVAMAPDKPPTKKERLPYKFATQIQEKNGEPQLE